MSWVAVGAAVVGAAVSYKGQKDATKAQQKSANSATAEQARQYDLAREDQAPWLNAGQNALAQIEQLNAGNFSSFQQSPDYQFALDQSLQALERGAAARGGFMGGGADADRIALASGLASQNYSNFYNRLAGQAGLGQQTATNLGGLGANYASNVGNIGMNAANQRASSYQNQANTIGGALTTAAAGYNNWNQQRNAANQGSLGNFGNNPNWWG